MLDKCGVVGGHYDGTTLRCDFAEEAHNAIGRDGIEIARVPLCAESSAEALPKTKSKMELLKDFFKLNK